MKTILKLSLTVLLLTLFTSCSSDDISDDNVSGISSKVVGKWHFQQPAGNNIEPNYFMFNSNSSMVYNYWAGTGTVRDEESGTWRAEGNKLTMIFPEGVTLTYIQNVEFLDDSTMKFVATENPNENPWDGTYYKE